VSVHLLGLAIGTISGLRAMTAPAAVSWASRLGWLDLRGSRLSLLGHPATPWVLTALALAEFVGDQRPSTASRTVPIQLGARLASGALCGAAIGAARGRSTTGLLAGVAGAAIGTYGGHALRVRLAARLHRDRPAALIEDAVAIGGAARIVTACA
jgi:uncharacterized membrane protein